MYVIFFGVGIGFILLSFVFDTLLDIDGPIGILQPKLIAIFLTVTGGAGIIISNGIGDVLGPSFTFTVSVFAGLLVAAILNRLVVIPLRRAQNTSAFDKQATIGTIAKIISPIPAGGFGKISYNISGSVVTSPAKSDDGGEILRGESVAIVYIEGGTYFVKKDDKQRLN